MEASGREVLRGDAQPKTTLSAHSRRSGTELGPSGAAPDQPFIVVAAAARGHLTGLGLAGKPTTFPKGAGERQQMQRQIWIGMIILFCNLLLRTWQQKSKKEAPITNAALFRR